jgi:hypothetical protein
MPKRIAWGGVLGHAEALVASYDTPVTLRQLFYRLVAAEVLPNTTTAYKGLSRETAQARRDGRFPPLIDQTRLIHKHQTFASAEDARAWLRGIYRHDRAADQDVSMYLGVEKRGIVEQLMAWFGELGLPVLSFGGYASQTYADEVAARAERDERTAVLIYAGDFDPSGEDIDRDFLDRAACFDAVHRIALTAAQVTQYKLPEQPGKTTDPRAARFAARHGRLVQVELDALPPNVLRDRYRAAVHTSWDASKFDEALRAEAAQRRLLDHP